MHQMTSQVSPVDFECIISTFQNTHSLSNVTKHHFYFIWNHLSFLLYEPFLNNEQTTPLFVCVNSRQFFLITVHTEAVSLIVNWLARFSAQRLNPKSQKRFHFLC